MREALAPRFGESAPPRRHHEPTPVAHDLYMKGRYAQARLIGGSIDQAIGFFEQAVAADPHYAKAHAGLADAWTLLAFWGVVRPHDAIPKAKAAAKKALELDPAIPEAHISRGVIQCSYDWNWEEGRRTLERAMEFDSDLALVHHAYANQVLLPRRRIDDAIQLQRKAIALDPFPPRPQATLTLLLGLAGRIEEAERQHAATLTTNPHFFFSHGTMALAYGEWQIRRGA